MNKRSLFVMTIAIVAVSLGIGYLIGWYLHPHPSAGMGGTGGEGASATSEPEILYWVAPMDPNYRRDKPGKSPMGMDLVPVYANENAIAEDEVQISPTVVQNLGVRTEKVRHGKLTRRLQTVGYVEYDENALHHVHTRVEGWIERLSVKAEGDPIEKGQVLFEIYSPTLVNAQEEYLLALKNGQDEMVEASVTRLQSVGLSNHQIEELTESQTANLRVQIHAKTNGVIGMLGVREGFHITPATHTMSIAELDKVWIVSEIPERYAVDISIGQEVKFELEANPGKQHDGEINYIYPELDLNTRSLKVRITFDGIEEVLRPNMFARITIMSNESEPSFHVPVASVIRGGLTDRVVLEVDEGLYRSAPVVVGREFGDQIQILNGLEGGETIVTSGQFLIDSESNIEAALARFEERQKELAVPTQVSVDGIFRSMNEEKMTMRVKHDAVPEWKWHTMTMNLKVAELSLMDDLDKDDEVTLTIEKQPEGGYLITDVEHKKSTSD